MSGDDEVYPRGFIAVRFFSIAEPDFNCITMAIWFSTGYWIRNTSIFSE